MLDVATQPGPSVAPGATVGDVVFTFSWMTWDAAAARGWFMPDDRLAHTLLASERVRRLVVCNRIRSLPIKVMRDLLPRRTTVPFPAGDRTLLVEPTRLRRTEPTDAAGLLRTGAAYDRALRRAAERLGLEAPAVITANPEVAGFAELAWARSVTYYAVDDWSAHPAHRRWWPAYREAYALIRARGRRVVAVSSVVRDAIAPCGPSAVVPNGLEPAEWQAPVAPAWVAGRRRPLLVYTGTLDSRLDVDAVLQVADRLPDASIVLAGPLTEPRHIEPLRRVANVELRAPMPRAEVAGLVHAADVGLIPHVHSPLSAGMSPLKLYEYLAAGLPVASVDLPPVRGVDPRVVLAPAGGDFADAVVTALERGRAAESERLAFVRANSWRARHDHVLDLALAA